MLTLTDFAKAITKLETAINAIDLEAGYDDLRDFFWSKRNAFAMAATFVLPRNSDEVIFLHQLLREQTEFVDGEPARESDRDDAIDAIHRMTENLRDYAIGT